MNIANKQGHRTGNTCTKINLTDFLKYQKENNKPDLSEHFKIQKHDKIDLNLFEKRPTETKKAQHVFIKPVIPPQSSESSKSFNGSNIANEVKLNQVKPTESQSLSQKASTFKTNNMQAYKSSGMNGSASYNPANQIGAIFGVNKTNSNVSGSNTSGGSNCNNAASNNQQYFAKINAMKYEPAANRCYKRKKEGDDEENDLVNNKSEASSYDAPADTNPFKSARDQLLIDNAKKNGGNHQQQQSVQSQAKRPMTNLPARGGSGTGNGSGIHKKFNLPMRNNDEETSNNNQHGANDTRNVQNRDLENLKNIDQKLIDTIMSEVMDKTPGVTWNDIAGLEFVKKTIKEIVIWPMLRPDIFKGLRGPPKGLLLFGPPGTGKTLIAKTIAHESGSTFFNISSSVLSSKWQGESEKLVKVLFEVARSFQPAVIFIDEIDSLLSQRSDDDRESSRRLKTEFFIQMDGCGTAADERILLIGATNRPQELDDAARRRFVKKLYIPLPEADGRKQIVCNLMRKQGDFLSEEEVNSIAEITDGYSGADMANLCREAAIGPIRSLESSSIIDIAVDEVRSINFQDFIDAMQQVRASVSQDDLEAYYKWNSQFGTMAIPK